MNYKAAGEIMATSICQQSLQRATIRAIPLIEDVILNLVPSTALPPPQHLLSTRKKLLKIRLRTFFPIAYEEALCTAGQCSNNLHHIEPVDNTAGAEVERGKGGALVVKSSGEERTICFP